MSLQHLYDAWLAHRDAARAARTKLGLPGYAYLLAMLRDEPCTAVELTRRARLGHVAAYRFLVSLHALGCVHVVDWRIAPRSRLPIFAYGPGQDEPPPTVVGYRGEPATCRMPGARLAPALIAFGHLLRALEVPASRTELVAATGLDKDTIQSALNVMLPLGLAHAPLWISREQGGDPLPQYLLGAGRNAPKPKVRASREHLAARRERARATRDVFKPLAAAFMPHVPTPIERTETHG